MKIFEKISYTLLKKINFFFLALEKAHQHMEDSHVAAYSALLIGLLAEGNTVTFLTF